MRNGYRLNEVGLSTTQVIDGFDLEEELLAMPGAQAPYAAGMHSDRCRIGGRTVNQAGLPGRFPAFLARLEEEGWIRRHADPRAAAAWNLIEGDRAVMFESYPTSSSVAVRLDRWRLASTRLADRDRCAAGGAGDGGRRRG